MSVQEIKCPSAEEMMHLEAILHKPINRMQRNSLLLQDMLQCTPPSHPDHKMFQNALKLSQHFLRDQMKISSTGNDKVLFITHLSIVCKPLTALLGHFCLWTDQLKLNYPICIPVWPENHLGTPHC